MSGVHRLTIDHFIFAPRLASPPTLPPPSAILTSNLLSSGRIFPPQGSSVCLTFQSQENTPSVGTALSTTRFQPAQIASWYGNIGVIIRPIFLYVVLESTSLGNFSLGIIALVTLLGMIES